MALGITAPVVMILLVVTFLRPGGGNEVQTDGKPPFSNLNRSQTDHKRISSLVRPGEIFGKALFKQCIAEAIQMEWHGERSGVGEIASRFAR